MTRSVTAARTATAVLLLAVLLPSLWLLLARTGWLPWEPFVALLPVAAYLIWRFGRGGSLRMAGFRIEPGWTRLLLESAALAALYEVLWIAVPTFGGVLTVTPAQTGTGSAWLTALVLAFLVGVVATALPEEFVYRGVLLRSMRGVWGVLAAVIASGLLFAYAHVPNLLTQVPESPQLYLVVRLSLLAVFGAALAWATLKTGSIWLALGWHAGGNLAGIALDMRFMVDLMGPVWLVGRVGAVTNGDGALAVAAAAGEVLLIAGLVRAYSVRR